MTRLPASGARIDTPRRAEAELKGVLCDLGLAQVLDATAVHELYWKFGEIIGQWSKERERLEVSPCREGTLVDGQQPQRDFPASRGRVYREPHPVCRKSNPAILVVKAAENGPRGNATDALDRSMERSVFAE